MSWLDKVTVTTAKDKDDAAKRRTRSVITSAVQAHLDTTAQERNYDSILNLCTYATSPTVKFADEAQVAVEWRDDVWMYCYAELDKVLSGLRVTPLKTLSSSA